MAVLLGKAFDLEVTVLSTSANKEKDAMELLNADRFVVTNDPQHMEVPTYILHSTRMRSA